uniref:Uncharacterized protein n=1 Tax=Aegilops tauschii subsp. strangulata TaxID=200361 RepID=A0A453PFC6_AEGTS
NIPKISPKQWSSGADKMCRMEPTTPTRSLTSHPPLKQIKAPPPFLLPDDSITMPLSISPDLASSDPPILISPDMAPSELEQWTTARSRYTTPLIFSLIYPRSLPPPSISCKRAHAGDVFDVGWRRRIDDYAKNTFGKSNLPCN